MSLRDILVHVDEGPNCEKRVALAMRIAKRQGSRLFALFAQSDSNVQGVSSNRDKRNKQHKKAGDKACRR